MVRAVLIDIDGTLVNSNDAHARAWVRAFAEHGREVPFGAVRRAIGMGGDQLMPRVSSITEDSDEGQDIAQRRAEIFAQECVPRLHALPGAADLVHALTARGLRVVAASSAKDDELQSLLAIAGAKSLLDHATSSDDADASKPAPDIVKAALQRAGVEPRHAIMIGDTPYDIAAASGAGVRTIAFRSGGWSDSDLRGAIAIYDGPWDLLEELDRSPLFASAASATSETDEQGAASRAGRSQEMAEPRRRDQEPIPELQDDRDVAHDDPSTHGTGTDTRPDHSEREWGGDQDIDTAGQVPGEMATDIDDASGF